eukprot:2054897-Pyramimonas_sp.AAC.1
MGTSTGGASGTVDICLPHSVQRSVAPQGAPQKVPALPPACVPYTQYSAPWPWPQWNCPHPSPHPVQRRVAP